MQLSIKTKNKQQNKKTGRRNRHFSKEDIQKVHAKMLNIPNYQKNANQNYNELSPHTGQNGYH